MCCRKNLKTEFCTEIGALFCTESGMQCCCQPMSEIEFEVKKKLQSNACYSEHCQSLNFLIGTAPDSANKPLPFSLFSLPLKCTYHDI